MALPFTLHNKQSSCHTLPLYYSLMYMSSLMFSLWDSHFSAPGHHLWYENIIIQRKEVCGKPFLQKVWGEEWLLFVALYLY